MLEYLTFTYSGIEVGDFVERDEEIATIETDKIDVSVNAPESGTIKEFLVNEEDTVTVGQDLVKLELGAAPEGGKKDEGAEKPKEPEPKESEPKKDASPAPAEAEKPKEPEPKKAAPPKEAPKAESKPQAAEQPALGDREERRVC